MLPSCWPRLRAKELKSMPSRQSRRSWSGHPRRRSIARLLEGCCCLRSFCTGRVHPVMFCALQLEANWIGWKCRLSPVTFTARHTATAHLAAWTIMPDNCKVCALPQFSAACTGVLITLAHIYLKIHSVSASEPYLAAVAGTAWKEHRMHRVMTPEGSGS